MSAWISMSAVLFISGLPGSETITYTDGTTEVCGDIEKHYTVEHLKKIIGPEFHPLSKNYPNYTEDSKLLEDKKACVLPSGSEGSIQYLVHEYSRGLPWVIVTFWGSLRDWEEDETRIKKWFSSLISDLHRRNYWCDEFTLRFSSNDGKIKIFTETSDFIVEEEASIEITEEYQNTR